MVGTAQTTSFSGGEDPNAKFAEVFGPGQIDQIIRQAVHFCWMALPKDRRNSDELESQIQRIVARALKDFRDDQQAFSVTTPK